MGLVVVTTVLFIIENFGFGLSPARMDMTEQPYGSPTGSLSLSVHDNVVTN